MQKLTSLALAAAFAYAQPAWSAPNFKVVFGFAGAKNGANPFAALINDSAGTFYGTTGSGGKTYNGVVYKLTPPAAGLKKWQQTVIYRFKGGNDGANADGPLVMDAHGALYGTTQWGGTGGFNGTIFRLTPVAGKTEWHETVLYRFGDNDGTDPVSGLVIDENGNLFGTACGCGLGASSRGTVFELSPPKSGKTKTDQTWTYTILHAFSGGKDGGFPYAGLVRDPSGALYGTTGGGGARNAGTVYRMTPPAQGQTDWTETVLYSFRGTKDGAYPHGGVMRDAATGDLYGTTQAGGAGDFGNGFGVVYKLSPPSGSGAWTMQTLYRFTGLQDGAQPAATVVEDASGTLYGSTPLGGDITDCAVMPGEVPGCGVVYQLTPPAGGQKAWTETVLHAFTGGNDGNGAWGGLLEAGGTLYGTTELAGPHFAGTVFTITP